MAPHGVRPEKIAKVSSSPVDFNNDGFPDLVTRSSFACLHNNSPSAGLTAYLKSDPAHAHKSLLMPLSQCESPIRQKDVKAWQFPGNRPGMWTLPYARFFNSDRSMFFRAGQTVALRSDPKVREVIQSPVFLYNYRTDTQLSPVFAMFSGCRFVSVDDLVWVTPSNDTLDMKRIFSLAKTPEPASENISKLTEVEVLKWVRGAFVMAETWPPQMEDEAKRDAVVSYVTASPIMQFLPNGWESSLLFTMNLPQLRLPPPPQPKNTFTCNRPPYAQSQ